MFLSPKRAAGLFKLPKKRNYMETFEIIGFGNPSIDIVHAENNKLLRFGGSVATVMIALSRWGVKASLIGRLGNDYNGKLLIKDLTESGVDISRLRVDEYPTSLWHINLNDEGRTILTQEYYKPLNVFSIMDESYVKSSGCVLVRFNNELFRKVAEASVRYKKDLFVTFHLLADKTIDDSIKVLKASSPKLVFLNIMEEEKLGGAFDEIVECSKIVVVTRGKEGCTVYTNGHEHDYNAPTVKVADPTGAGDAFAAGFIYGYLNQWPVDETTKFANAIGAITTMDYGTRTKITTVRDALDLVKLTD